VEIDHFDSRWLGTGLHVNSTITCGNLFTVNEARIIDGETLCEIGAADEHRAFQQRWNFRMRNPRSRIIGIAVTRLRESRSLSLCSLLQFAQFVRFVVEKTPARTAAELIWVQFAILELHRLATADLITEGFPCERRPHILALLFVLSVPLHPPTTGRIGGDQRGTGLLPRRRLPPSGAPTKNVKWKVEIPGRGISLAGHLGKSGVVLTSSPAEGVSKRAGDQRIQDLLFGSPRRQADLGKDLRRRQTASGDP